MTRKTAPEDRSLFDDFLPHLIARLAYQLNGEALMLDPFRWGDAPVPLPLAMTGP